MTQRLCGMVLWSQMLVLVFAAVVGRALMMATSPSNADLALWAGLSLAVLCVVAAMSLRGRVGIALGWLVQLATFAYALVVPMMLLVGLLFGALWLVAIRKGRQMDELTRRYLAEQAADGR